VLAIMGVVAAIAAPRYATASKRYTLDGHAQRLESDLKFAQQTARATSRSWRVVVSADGLSYEVEAVPLAAATATTLEAASAEASADLTGTESETTANAELSGATLERSETGLAAAKLGVTTLDVRVLRSGKLLIDGSVVSSLSRRTLVFDGFGRPSRSLTFDFEDGHLAAEVEVRANGEIVRR